MIQFKIGKKEYTVGEPTISDYYTLQTQLVADTAKAKLEIVSHLSGCQITELRRLDNLQFATLWTEIVTGPLNQEVNNTFYKHFLLNDKLYGFSDFKSMTIGEFADMDVMRQDPRKDGLLHKMMAVLYRPAIQISGDWIVVEDYKSEEVDDRAEEFLKMPLKYVFGALTFFLQIRKTSIETMLDSLTVTKEMTKEEAELVHLTKQLISSLPETGTGLSASWLETTLLRLQTLQDLVSTMPLTSSPTEKTKPKKKKWSWKSLRLKVN